MASKTLEFRHLFVSSAVNENTVTVFGEQGTAYQKGTDYDEMIEFHVSSRNLSNLVAYYNGNVPDGQYGSADMPSLISVNAPVSSIKTFNNGYQLLPGGTRSANLLSKEDGAAGGKYNLGDVVLYSPDNDPTNASCWTCIRSTSIPGENAIPLVGSVDPSKIGTQYKGFYGTDRNGQNFLQGVIPATRDPVTKVITRSPYWSESTIAKSFQPTGNYYNNELVVYNGAVYQVKSTDGKSCDPELYQNANTTAQQEKDGVPPASLALAPNGAFGYDSVGSRYIQGVPPSGSGLSSFFWKASSLPLVPTSTYTYINWDNVEVNSKLVYYDENMPGGNGAQAFDTFTDDANDDITTLRKIYNDNEKGFVLDVAQSILSRIPAAAIKNQTVGQRPEPDSTLVEMVHSGPHATAPNNYQPTVQGVFEEALYEDMLQIGGFKGTIVNYTVTDSSSGYTSVPTVRVSAAELATNPTLIPFAAQAVARLGVDSIFIDKTHASWAGATGYQAGDDLTFEDDSESIGKPFYIRAKAEIYGVDSLTGCVTSVKITTPGSGYTKVPKVKDSAGTELLFLNAILKVVSVDSSNSFVGFVNNGPVNVLYGSGQGATGTAVVDGDGRLTAVNITNGGSGYKSSEYKQDIVKLQGLGLTGGVVARAVAPAVVTAINPVSGAIGATGITLLLGGSAYTSEPTVTIDGPAIDLTATAGLTAGDRNLLAVTNGGRYSSEAYAVDWTSLVVSTGVSAVEITNRGAGYSVGDKLVFSGGGYAPASFSTGLTGSTYSLSIANGGGGYFQDDVLVLSNGTTGGDQIIAKVTSCGGRVVAASFNPLSPFESGYAVGNTFQTEENVLFEVQTVGPSGQLRASVVGGVTGDSVGTGVTGYQVGDVLIATPKFYSIRQIDLINNGTHYTAMPVVTIDAPTATDANLTNVQATATATLCLASFSAIGDSGSLGGDVIEISQAGVTDSARLVVLSTDADGHIVTYNISDAGSGFDPSNPSTVTSSNPNAVLGTTTVRYTVSSIQVTNPGLGYGGDGINVTLTNKAANLPAQVTTATSSRSGGGGTFEITNLPITGSSSLQLLNPGSGYVATDLITLGRAQGDPAGVVSGLYFKPTAGNLLSGNVLSAKVLDSPAGFSTGERLKLNNSECFVTQLSASDSISGISVLKYEAGSSRYPSGTSLSHKALTVATVSNVDISTGAILDVQVSNSGYGYAQLPAVSVSSQTGQNASLNVPYLSVTRAEWVDTAISVSSADLTVSPPSAPLPAQAVANMTGSLYNLDLDQQRNPGLLSALENVKTGSTTGYAQAIPNLGVAAVTVQETGRNLGDYGDLSVVFSPPESDKGVVPVAVIDSSGYNASLKSVTSITVLNPGSGYTKPPSIVIVNRTGAIPTVAAMLKPVMKLTGVSITSRGLGFLNPPTATISKPDYGTAVAPTATTTLQARVQSFEVSDSGAHYSEVPNMTVVSQGTGTQCSVAMGVSDIKIVSGGTGGFQVGDTLVFSGSPTVAAQAVVSTVDSDGKITGVIINEKATSAGQDVHGNSVAVLNNSDFTGFGGKGYTGPPDVTAITRSGTTVSACGEGDQPAFSCRLGINQFTVSNGGKDFVCDGQVIVEPPPFSQDARYAAVVNAGNGTISSFAQIVPGYGYSSVPNVEVVGGGGSNAAASAVMGISDIFVADGGAGYSLGDVVVIPCPASGTTASAVVTGLDAVPTKAAGLDLAITISPLVVGADASVSGGAMTTFSVLNGGVGFKTGDSVTFPTRNIPSEYTGTGAAAYTTTFTPDLSFKVAGGELKSFALEIERSEHAAYVSGDLFKVTVGSKFAVARLNMNARPNPYFGGLSLHTRKGGVVDQDGARQQGIVIRTENTMGYITKQFNFYHLWSIIEPQFTVLKSSSDWTQNDVKAANVKFEFLNPSPVYPTFKVTEINDQNGAIVNMIPDPDVAAAAKLTEDNFLTTSISSRKSITYVQIVSAGRGYSKIVDNSQISVKKPDGTPSLGSGAKFIPSLGVVALAVANPGSGYNIAPKVYIDSPLHSSTAPQLYARSAQIASSNGLVLLNQGHSYLPGGVYQLVPLATGGGLHQSGNVNNSVDTVLTLRTGNPTDFMTSQGMTGILTQAAIDGALQTVIGSNYRVGDVLQLVPVGKTRSGASATVKVGAVTSAINTSSNPSGKFNDVPTNTGSGIMDYGHKDPNNGKDVGGYGTGYVSVPKVQILGGNQGVTTNCNIGVVGVDYATTNSDDQGTKYTVGDAIFSNSNEAGSVKIGEVTQVDTTAGDTQGSILRWTIYSPFQSGLSMAPTISVQRQTVVPNSKDAKLIAVMGITNITIVTNASGFIGEAVVRVDTPYGAPSAVVTPKAAYVVANVQQEVADIVFQEVVPNNPALYTKLPVISIAPPPSISRFLGWFGVRFNPADAFEFIVQYTIAKAIAFQVDQDASLPGYYFVADSIMIGGVTIPLRQPGGAGAQGREMSANRIIRKYMVRMIAV